MQGHEISHLKFVHVSEEENTILSMLPQESSIFYVIVDHIFAWQLSAAGPCGVLGWAVVYQPWSNNYGLTINIALHWKLYVPTSTHFCCSRLLHMSALKSLMSRFLAFSCFCQGNTNLELHCAINVNRLVFVKINKWKNKIETVSRQGIKNIFWICIYF